MADIRGASQAVVLENSSGDEVGLITRPVWVAQFPGIRYFSENATSIASAAGRVASSLFLPAAASVHIFIVGMFAYYDADTATFRPEFRRVTAASGGTLRSGVALAKRDTADANSAAEVRYYTATLAVTEVTDANGGLISTPGPLKIIQGTSKDDAVSLSTHTLESKIRLRPGEGLIYKWVTDPSQNARINWIWEEFTP